MAAPAAAQPAGLSAAERLYRDGILPSGKPLVGERMAGITVEGTGAACVNCHRRSGLGTSEGEIIIPPITGTYLFRPRGRQFEDMDLRYLPQYSRSRVKYTEADVARAIRDGINPSGVPLNYLMPRYKLDDATMASLIGYLRTLSKGPYPGVTASTLHFATIITPDADSVARRAMLAVMNQFFSDKNEFVRGGQRMLKRSTGVAFRVVRHWQLHVWELKGAPDTWERQLDRQLAKTPVLAVISGLGGRTWAPVHRFCERNALPCLWPNVDLPVVNESDFYNLYFDKGVLLESELIGKDLAEKHGELGVRRLIQIYRQGDVGRSAARDLGKAARAAGLKVVNRALKDGAPRTDLARAVKAVRPGDAVALWLRPADLSRLPAPPRGVGMVYLSGLMGKLENAPLPKSWRPIAHMAYPADVPERRKFRMNYPMMWLKVRHIPLLDARIQANTYLACGIVAETLTGMLDTFVPEYLIERLEDMLSYRVLTGYYPRLGLAPGQRFASKGGYIVHFPAATDTRIVADGGWIVPR